MKTDRLLLYILCYLVGYLASITLVGVYMVLFQVALWSGLIVVLIMMLRDKHKSKEDIQ